MVTTVQARVHNIFPVPITLAILLLLVYRIGTDLHPPCVPLHGSFNRSFAPPDYSRRTCSQGHAVPSVVSVGNKTQRAWSLPDRSMPYKEFCKADVKQPSRVRICLFLATKLVPLERVSPIPHLKVWTGAAKLSQLATPLFPLFRGQNQTSFQRERFIDKAVTRTAGSNSSRTMDNPFYKDTWPDPVPTFQPLVYSLRPSRSPAPNRFSLPSKPLLSYYHA